MPNGGVLPSCSVCQWAQGTGPTTISCRRHGITVFLALHSFCRELSNQAYPGLVDFIRQNGITGNGIHIWLEIQHRTPEHPDIPQYDREFAPLAPVDTYASWTEAEDRAARRILYERWVSRWEES